MPSRFTPAFRERTRAYLEGIIGRATVPWEHHMLCGLDDETERMLSREVDRVLYEPALPFGGARERSFIEKLKRLAQNRDWAGRYRAMNAAKAWEEVLGGYYQCKGLRDPKEIEWYQGARESANSVRDWDKKWFAELMLKGLPAPVSNFRIDCRFLLHRGDHSNPTIERLVVLENKLGERTKLERMDSESFAAPQKFRIFLNNRGGYVWRAGERELNDLQQDISVSAAWKHVTEIVSVGWHPLGGHTVDPEGRRVLNGLWFFADGALDPLGASLPKDEHGIFWHQGRGYLLSDRAREGVFYQGRPVLRFGETLYARFHHADRAFLPDVSLEDRSTVVNEDTLMHLFFRETCRRIENAVGDVDGWLALGSMLAFIASPEIYARYSCFPGLWVHGIAGSGKSTLAAWLIRFWGINMEKGISLKNSSAAGMKIACEQYSAVPIWLDEFREQQAGDDIIGVIRGSFDRAGHAKWSPDGVQREMKTCFMISGETTTKDSATRGRFPFIQMDPSRRVGRSSEIDWFSRHKEFFPLLTRWLLERRPQYVASVLSFLQRWVDAPELRSVAERDKMVYGTGYAALMAVEMVLGITRDAAANERLRQYCLAAVRTASSDVVSELNTTQFWNHLINCYEQEALSHHDFLVKKEGNLDYPPGSPNQNATPWPHYRLFFKPGAVISKMSAHLTKARDSLPLQRNDLRDQLRRHPSWVQGEHTLRFSGDDSTTKAWGIDLNLHPQGLQPVSDEQYAVYLADRNAGDPRKGPLFAIVADVERRRSQGET